VKFRVRQDITTNNIVYRAVRDLPSEAHQVFRDGFFSYMKELKKFANKEILRKPKSGKTYTVRVNGRRRRHVASRPWETHANLTGKLRRSLSWKVQGWERASFGYGISTSSKNKAPKYAPFVEEGTRFMKPRPSLSNAVKLTKRDVHFDRALDKFIKGFGT
jgi:hypothetical protein